VKKPKRKKKISLRTQLRRLHKKADSALSLFVRAITDREYGGLCPLCHVNPIECCFHFIRRKRKVLRWDIRNVVGACHRCNYLEYRDPDPSRAWFIRKFGVDQYLRIVDESKESFDPTIEFLQGIVDEYTELLRLFTTKDVFPEVKVEKAK
jgi:hypothetical protein